MSKLSLELPCKPVVKQYLVNSYGINAQDMVNLPDHDWIRHLLLVLLERNHTRFDKSVNIQYYTEKVLLPISMDDLFRYGHGLSKTGVQIINNRIEDIISQRLHLHLEFFVHVAGYQLKDAIEMFQIKYNFPEEVFPRETITKRYQRNVKPALLLHNYVGYTISRSANYRAKNNP